MTCKECDRPVSGHCQHCSPDCTSEATRKQHTGITSHWVAHWDDGHCPMCAAAPTQGVLL